MVELRLTEFARLNRLRNIALRSFGDNVRTRGVMASPPTVTDDGTSLPSGQTNGLLRSSFNDFFRETGGLFNASNSALRSVRVSSGAYSYTFARWRFVADAAKVTVRLNANGGRFRFIVNGQFLDLTGIIPGGNGNRYVSLTFAGRSRNEIVVEASQVGGFVGVYVGATEKIMQSAAPVFRSVSLGDSWNQGAAATGYYDGIDVVMADHLGWSSHMNSGSGGTGWVANGGGTIYNFLDRINNGDLGLNGTPDIVTLQGSINDKNSAAAAVTANALAGLQKTRELYPAIPILMYGVWPASGGAGGTLSIAANEQAISDAVTAFGDRLTAFIPINGAYGGAPLSGTGFVGSTTGTGNADVVMADASHLNTVGTLIMGRWKAERAIDALNALAA